MLAVGWLYGHTMKTLDLAWLAGLLEGEGSFLKGSPSKPNRPRVSLQMTDADVVNRAAALMGAGVGRKYDRRNPNWKPIYQVVLSGGRSVDLMKRLRPHMGQRRQQQIDEAMACFEDRSNRLTDHKVRDIREAARVKGVTQGEVATRFGVARETVNKIVNEKGRYAHR